MNVIAGVFFLLLPFIILFGVIWRMDGIEMALKVYGIVAVGSVGMVVCVALAKYFLGLS